MKKILVILIGILCFTGCSIQNTEEINIKELETNLTENIEFEDELTLFEGSPENIYGIEGITSSVIYLGSGSTAEELAILEFENTKATDQAQKKLEKYIEDRKKSYESYNPKEVERLENTMIVKKECVIVLCVSLDKNVMDVINRYL